MRTHYLLVPVLMFCVSSTAWAVDCSKKANRSLTACKTPAAAAQPIDAATYKPKTAHDNSPWRFDMHQNGKRMTAEEFDAWMKSRGVRIAKGAPGASDAPEQDKKKNEKGN